MQKRTVKETSLRPASSATVTSIMHRKLTFKLSLWFNKQLNYSWRNPVWRFLYPFLNFRVGVGQRGFRIKGVKCIERNPFLAVLCRISGQNRQYGGLTFTFDKNSTNS